MTGHIRSGRGSIPRFLVSPILGAFSSARLLMRRRIGRFTGDVRLWGVRRFVARVSFLAPVRARLMRCAVLLHRSVLFVLRPNWGTRLRRIRLGLCLSRVRFFRGVLAL